MKHLQKSQTKKDEKKKAVSTVAGESVALLVVLGNRPSRYILFHASVARLSSTVALRSTAPHTAELSEAPTRKWEVKERHRQQATMGGVRNVVLYRLLFRRCAPQDAEEKANDGQAYSCRTLQDGFSHVFFRAHGNALPSPPRTPHKKSRSSHRKRRRTRTTRTHHTSNTKRWKKKWTPRWDDDRRRKNKKNITRKRRYKNRRRRKKKTTTTMRWTSR